jgi:antitoxin (DNA-binding transcriptional repressor) of toxin-antitoxin stability system
MNWAVQDAKARFSELLRAAEKGPQVITYRGEPAYEVRKIELGQRRKSFLDVLKACPKVPEFELPERKAEPPRKIFDDEK